jgi:flagellar biosynthesis protein FliR
MITVTSAQLDAWIVAFLFPLARILGLLGSAPVFNNAAMPRRVRLMTGLAIALALVPALPPMPAVPAGSWIGLAILAQQMLIGILMGFALRIAFAAVDIAGEMIGLQMGLSFAVFYDPQNTSQTPVITEFFGLLATLIFLAMNGHLLLLDMLAESFMLWPVSATPFQAAGLGKLVAGAAMIFVAGVLISLPLVVALLIANIAMGVLARVAPQLNLFAVGFPVTMFAGFVVVGLSLPYFGAALEAIFSQGFQLMRAVMRASAGS